MNIISLVVMLQRHNRQISVCNYLAVLSVTDSIMLCLAGEYWLFSLLGGLSNENVCKIFTWIYQFISLAGICLIIAMTTDRVVAICIPHRARYICTPLKARVVSAVLLIVSPIYSIPHMFASGYAPDTRICVAFRYSSAYLKVYSWVNICLNSILPFLLLMTMNSLIIHTMCNRTVPMAVGPVVEAVSGSSIGRRATARRMADRQLTFMLLLVTFTLLFLTLPMYVRYSLFLVIDYTKDQYMFSVYIFLSHLTNKMFFTNNAVNFYLYCITGTKFRSDLAKMVRKTCRSKPGNRVAPAPTIANSASGSAKRTHTTSGLGHRLNLSVPRRSPQQL